MNNLSVKDPVYYKAEMQKLLNKARANGLEISLSSNHDKNYKLLFKDENDECAGVLLLNEEERDRR